MSLTDPYLTVAEFRARVGSVSEVADAAILAVPTEADDGP